jgi:hypothetical protein
VLLAAMTAAPLFSTGVSALGPLIRNDLRHSRTEFGLFTLALCATTSALSVPSGWLADRIPTSSARSLMPPGTLPAGPRWLPFNWRPAL